MIKRNLTTFERNFMAENMPIPKKPIRDVEGVHAMLSKTGWDDEEDDDVPQKNDSEAQTESDDIESTEMDDGFFFAGMYSGSTKGTISNKIEEAIEGQKNDGKEYLALLEKANGVVYEISETKEESAEEVKARQRIIDDTKLILVECIKEASRQYGHKEMPRVRKYRNTAKMEKIIYAKPVDVNGGGAKKFVLFLLCCIGASVFFGLKANSYYIYMNGKTTAMSCSFGWLTVEGVPMIFNPLYMDIFWITFGIWFGIILLIGLFIWLDSEQKKQSRVGHEHGKARLGTNRDFKTHKIKFMDR